LGGKFVGGLLKLKAFLALGLKYFILHC
jgi:hypothetical protein